MYNIQSVRGFSKTGKRANNEDSVYPFLEGDTRTENLKAKIPLIGNLYLVCDGVGGANKGEIASQLICTNFPLYFSNNPPASSPLTAAYLQKGLEWVENAMDLFIQNNPETKGMASTLTLLYFDAAGANIAWAGDSRVYHYRDGQLLYQTQDHSLVNELIKSGEITSEEAEKHPQKNVILRAVQGGSSPTRIEYHFIPWEEIQKGDEFLLCSDGVTETWIQDALNALFQDNLNQDTRVKHMEMACQVQSRDNYSAYLIQIGDFFIADAGSESGNKPELLIPVEGSEPDISTAEPQVMEPAELTTTAIHDTPVVEVNHPEAQEITTPLQMIVEDPVAEEIVVPEVVTEKINTQDSGIMEEVPPVKNLEEVPLTRNLISPEKPVIEVPPIPNPELAAPEVKIPVAEPAKSKAWILWGILLGILLITLLGILWYFIDGPGAANKNFEKYYASALDKVAQCEKVERCNEAKGVVNQAKSAAETMQEHEKADSLMARVLRKEAEIRKRSVINVPEPTDKGKADEKADGNPKSKTPTPKTTTKPATSPGGTTSSTTATVKPGGSTSTTTPKTTDKPAGSATSAKPPVQVSPSNIPADKVKPVSPAEPVKPK